MVCCLNDDRLTCVNLFTALTTRTHSAPPTHPPTPPPPPPTGTQLPHPTPPHSHQVAALALSLSRGADSTLR